MAEGGSDISDQQLQAQLQAHAAAAAASISSTGLMPDGRPIQVRPCKYYPNCAKMDDPEHNAMYSHNSVVKKPPRPAPGSLGSPGSAAAAAMGLPPANLQLCGFGEHCKRCGDEEHLDKYVHSCKFGARCKKVDDPVHLKRFIHVLPGQLPPVPAFTPGPRGARLSAAAVAAAAAAMPYAPYGGYPPPYGYPYSLPPPLAASSYSGAGAFPSTSHHSRASAASYHPYGGGGGGSGSSDRGYGSYGDRRPSSDRAKDDWATMAATIAGYGQAAAYGDLRAAAEGFGAYGAYNGLPGDTPYSL